MATNQKVIELSNRVKSIKSSDDPAVNHIVAGADDIYDDEKGKKQSEVNQDVDAALENRYTKEETYNKTELNNLITTPNVNYVTVGSYASLPATGAADTIYRVSNYDGAQSQVDATKYSEYAWNGSVYVFLSVKTQIGEVFDISEYHSGAVYADLSDALGTNGANIPATIKKGGMSVKFKQIATPAEYSVDKTEGLDEQPTGTELLSDPGIDDGTYNASQLSAFTTLPTSTGAGNAVTYWMAVAGDSTTYTKWVVTLVHTDDNKYMQYRLMLSTFTAAQFTNTTNWQGVDDKPTPRSNNLVESGGVYGELRLIKDALGGVDLIPIEFVPHTTIYTGVSILRNDGTNITQEATGANNQSVAIQVTPGDEFLLNNIGGGFSTTAYLFAKSDFSVIQDSRSENNHTCKEEVITAPTEAAWLVLNNIGNENPCYYGGSIISDTDKKIAIEKSRAEAAETNLQGNIDANAKRNVDNLGGVVLGGVIELTRGYYLDTSGSSIPTNEGEVVPTARSSSSYAFIHVQEGDMFTLNSKGGNSKYRAYAWVRSDFSIITPKVASDYNCVYDAVTAPAEAAYLVVNYSISNAPDSYYGTNFKNYVDKRVSVVSDSSAETRTISIGGQTYGVSSDNTSKRLLSSIVIATATANVSTTGTSTQNIINGNYSVRKGGKLRITVSGLITYVKNFDLLINGVVVALISEPTFVYTCDSDVTAIRILARVGNVVADGSVSATVELLSIYNAIGDVNDKTLGIDNLVYKSDSADVYGNTLLYPKWHHTSLLNNGAHEYASDTRITSEFIPVDTLAFLRVSCSCDFLVFRYDKDKNRLSTTDYSGDSVIAFNPKIGSSNTKYIRLRMNTGNSEDVVISCDSLVSRLNNKRLLGNKNVKCFGHRGSGLRSDISGADNYPSSIWGAYINGFDGVHFNVQFTTDHVPYCLHDPTFVDDVSGETITLNNCTSSELEGYTRDGQPIAKVESAIYMAKMMGLDVIIYNPYGTVVAEDYDVLVNLVKKYDMFEHTWFGIPGRPGSPNTTYLNKIVAAYPKANVMRTEEDITSAEYSSITALIADAESMLQSYPNLNIALWINSEAHPEQHFIDANMDKPWDVRLAVHGLATDRYATIMPYISFYTAQIGNWSFGAVRRNVEKIVTDKYPEFMLGDYGNVI